MRRLNAAFGWFLLTALCAPALAATSSEVELAFYQAAGRGDGAGAYGMLHPAAQEQVDPPVFQAWAAAMKDRLGKLQSLEQTAWSREVRLSGSRTDITSTLTFERGVATASIGVKGGKVISFNIESERLRDWFHGPATIDIYAQRGEAFTRAFLEQRASVAFELMDPALQKVVDREGLDQMIETVTSSGGPLTKLTLASHRYDAEADAPSLLIVYDVECENADGKCELEFRFDGMRGSLVGFSFK